MLQRLHTRSRAARRIVRLLLIVVGAVLIGATLQDVIQPLLRSRSHQPRRGPPFHCRGGVRDDRSRLALGLAGGRPELADFRVDPPAAAAARTIMLGSESDEPAIHHASVGLAADVTTAQRCVIPQYAPR